MTSLILFAALVGVLFFLPLSAISWVRATVGRLLGLVFGKARASAASRETAVSGDSGAIARTSGVEEVRPARTNNPTFAQAASNIARFLAGCVAFFAKHPMLCIGLILLGVFLAFGGPRLPFGKSNDLLALEARLARAEELAQRTQAELHDYAGKRGDKTQAREAAIQAHTENAQREIANVAPQDFDGLHSAYDRLYRVRPNTSADEGVSDPAAPRFDPVPRARTDPA